MSADDLPPLNERAVQAGWEFINARCSGGIVLDSGRRPMRTEILSFYLGGIFALVELAAEDLRIPSEESLQAFGEILAGCGEAWLGEEGQQRGKKEGGA